MPEGYQRFQGNRLGLVERAYSEPPQGGFLARLRIPLREGVVG